MAEVPDSYPPDVRDTFVYCPDCETVLAELDGHTCGNNSTGGYKSAARRAELASLDDRPLDEDVLFPRGRSLHNAWAYHELDEDGEPLHQIDHDSGHQVDTRAAAIDSGCYPCGRCEVLQESATSASGDGDEDVDAAVDVEGGDDG